MAAFALMGGLSVFVLIYAAMVMPAHPNKKKASPSAKPMQASHLLSLQKKLDDARIDVRAEDYVTQWRSNSVCRSASVCGSW